MSPTRYIVLVGAVFCGLLALSALDAWAQAGAPTKHGYYTCSYVRAKIAVGSAISTPKLVIVSGSNALAGIDTPALAKALAIRGFNFGLAGPGYQLFEAAKILRPKDAVLMPLEYLAYDYSTPRDSLIDAVYSCGVDYWHSLDWRQKLFFVVAAKPLRLLDSLLFRSNPQALHVIATQAAQDVGAYGQGSASGAPMRDAAAGQEVTSHMPLIIRFDPQSPGALAIAQFVAWAKSHHVTVFATWPNTLYYPQYENCIAFRQIRDFYRGLGVEMIGAPRESMFPSSLMGDTIYHLNRKGMNLRTARLIRALNSNPPFSAWRHAAAATASP
jgi:hypothetical protein